MNLFEIDSALAELENELVEAGGEISEEMDAKLNDLLDSREDKVDGYIAVIRSQKALAAAFKLEEDRLKQNRTARENVAKRLTERLYESMNERGEKELVGRLGKAKVQANGGKAPIVLLREPEDIPIEYQRVTITADLDAIRDDLETGAPNMGFAEFAERGTHLRIY